METQNIEFKYDSYCGLYCGACKDFLKTKSGENPEGCHGCKSDHPAGHCAICEIKTCAKQKGFAFCYECDQMDNCNLLQPFITDERYPYHQGVLKNLAAIKQNGVTVWLTEQETRWQCKCCGSAFSWWDETCPDCKQPVDSYKADL